MRGLTPTGMGARTVPKPAASTGLLGSQLGLVGRATAEQSGMLMMLTEPGLTPSPALATTISLRAGAKSAQSGEVPTAIGLVAPEGTVSSWLVWTLMTLTVPSVWFMMKARRVSAVMMPYTGPRPTGIGVGSMVLVAVSMVETWPGPPLV